MKKEEGCGSIVTKLIEGRAMKSHAVEVNVIEVMEAHAVTGHMHSGLWSYTVFVVNVIGKRHMSAC
ncbi:MAG: hypothetical protein WAM14_06010 [Candidatus Nitrosopolaris sp.]